MTRLRKGEKAVFQPLPRRSGVPLASEAQREKLRELLGWVYVNKKVSRSLGTGLRNGTLTKEEADWFLNVYRLVELRRARAAASGSLTSRSRARSVRCPACGAEPGSPCIGARNKVRESCHRERHEVALRSNLASGRVESKTGRS